jgi:hypothetical protein
LTLLGKTFSGFLEPPALADELEEVAVVHQSIEERCDDDGVTEHGREPPNSIE